MGNFGTGIAGEHRERRRDTTRRKGRIDNPRRLHFVELFATPVGDLIASGEPHQRTLVEAPEDGHDVAELITIQAAAGSKNDRVGLPGLQFVCEAGASRVRPAS